MRALLALDDTPLAKRVRDPGIEVSACMSRFAAWCTPPLPRNGLPPRSGSRTCKAGLSPGGKARRARPLPARVWGRDSVGDGLNDAPVLADADVGIAVGSTHLARETAFSVLPPGGLWMPPDNQTVARKVRSTILTNLAWAFGYNLIALTLAVAGVLQPVLAAAVMASSSFSSLSIRCGCRGCPIRYLWRVRARPR